MNWISPNIINGPVATGSQYFKRKNFEIEILTHLERGEYILLNSPRRYGKSSIAKYLAGTQCGTMLCVFENIQDIDSENELYKRIYELIYEKLNKLNRYKKTFTHFLSKRSIKKIGTDGIELKENEIDYKTEVEILLQYFSEKDINFVIFLDELPEVLHNLLQQNQKKKAQNILKTLRHWRQNQQQIRFVILGSIGMRYVEEKITGRHIDNNDYYEVNLTGFDRDEAKRFVLFTTAEASMKLNDDIMEYLFDKIDFLIPFFIVMMLDKLDDLAKQNNEPEISREMIDKAFDSIVENNTNFMDWKRRIFVYFAENEANYIMNILTHIAHKNAISMRKAYDISHRYGLSLDFAQLLNDLEKDGYIVQKNENYYFNSPFLKAFWKKDQPFYDE